MNTYLAGMDVGSTTVKLVLLDENGNMVFGAYERHGARTQETLAGLLRRAGEQLGPCRIRPSMTGSGAMNLCKALGISFVQEVVAVAGALE